MVLVHGLGGRCEDWRNLAPYLVRAGFRVYMPDLPGYGRSEKPADFSYSIPDQGRNSCRLYGRNGVEASWYWAAGRWAAGSCRRSPPTTPIASRD